MDEEENQKKNASGGHGGRVTGCSTSSATVVQRDGQATRRVGDLLTATWSSEASSEVKRSHTKLTSKQLGDLGTDIDLFRFLLTICLL
jgi:hypothetical protein